MATENVLHMEPCAISLNALNGIAGYQTLRVAGYTEQVLISILIDLGSTHNFIGSNFGEKWAAHIQIVATQSIKVVDGSFVGTT